MLNNQKNRQDREKRRKRLAMIWCKKDGRIPFTWAIKSQRFCSKLCRKTNNYTCNINALYLVYSLCYCTVRMYLRELLLNKGNTVSG